VIELLPAFRVASSPLIRVGKEVTLSSVKSDRGFFTKIAGVSHTNPDGTDRQGLIRRCSVGEFLRLVREPANPYDRNAVKVLRHNGDQLGYIPSHVLATGLARDMDRGVSYRAEITALTGRNKATLGVNIRVVEGEIALPAQSAQPKVNVSPIAWAIAGILIACIAILFYLGFTD